MCKLFLGGGVGVLDVILHITKTDQYLALILTLAGVHFFIYNYEKLIFNTNL